MLKFFGISNGMSRESSTSAFFEYKGNLIIIDCSIDTTRKLFDIDLEKYRDIFVVVTHTHSDHIGGIGMLVAYLGYNKGMKLNIIMPTQEMVNLFNDYLINIEGADKSHYRIGVVEDFDGIPEMEAIETSHSELLCGKCFGWTFMVENNYIVYTGDTNTLVPFIEYIRLAKLKGFNVYLYTEINTKDNGCHLYIDKNLDILRGLYRKGVKVFVMHVDDIDKIKEKIRGSGIIIAPLYIANDYLDRSKKLVIVINGKGGCGKDTLIRGVADCYRVRNVSSIDHIKHIASQMGWHGTKDAKSRTFLADLKQLCIKYNNMPLHDMLKEYEAFMGSNDEILFIHIREGEEIDKLKQFINGIKTILVKKDETDRGEYANSADNDVEGYDYDYVFNNNGDIVECRLEFVKLIDRLLDREE